MTTQADLADILRLFCIKWLLVASSFTLMLTFLNVYSRNISRQGNLSQRKCSYVIIGRIMFSILGIFQAAVVTYTVITDGLPFRKELLTP
jgi:hypothetical protein